MRLPGRGVLVRGLRGLKRVLGGGVVLLYHRVAETARDPQLLCVSPRHFAEHLEVLSQRCHPVSVAEMLRRAREGRSLRGLVALTFDDGYADNLHSAKPLLERYGIPATVFVVVEHVRTGREFWWDELEHLFLRGGGVSPASAADSPGKTGQRRGRGEDRGAREERIYRTVYGRLRYFSPGWRRVVLDRLWRATGAGLEETPTRGCPLHRPLTVEELRQLVDGGLVRVGAHTLNHPVLAKLAPEEQEREIMRSKAELEEMTGASVDGFAFPYGGAGDYTQVTVDLVRSAGFAWACANRPGRVERRTDPYQVPRFLVRDWDGEEFERRLAGFV